MHRLAAVGKFRRDVVRLTEILAQVVELERAVFEELDQLPVALANRTGGRTVMIVRQVPEQRIASECRGGVAQHREQTHAVKHLLLRRADAGGFEESGIE